MTRIAQQEITSEGFLFFNLGPVHEVRILLYVCLLFCLNIQIDSSGVWIYKFIVII